MGQRRNSRELAMQALYYIDLSGEKSFDAYKLFCVHHEPEEGINIFFRPV